jgi:hypothetical protein
MTYVPVPAGERKGHGRTPLEIPAALLAQLQHSRATGAICEIDLDGTEDPDEVAELRRQLVRAGYRHFSENTIYKKFRTDKITYWVGPKLPRGKKNGETE